MRSSAFFYACAVFVTLVLGMSPSEQSFSAEPTIQINFPARSKKKTFTRSELLKMSEAAPLLVTDDSAYPGVSRSYRVVEAAKLFDGMGIAPDSLIQFTCLDGFSAPLTTSRLLNRSPKESVAFIAIEDEKSKWPAVKPDSDATAGPFYLVWKNPKLSHVSPEEWPYQLAGFEVKPSLAETFPKMVPDPKLASSAVKRGLEIFVKNCFACHTFNKSGESHMGPDLNVPYSPTEYLTKKHFEILVRNPQNLRHWPESKMASFSPEVLSEADFKSLVTYFEFMSHHKVK